MEARVGSLERNSLRLLGDLALFGIHSAQGDLQFQHLHELRTAVDGANLCAQHPIQHEAHRLRHDPEQ